MLLFQPVSIARQQQALLHRSPKLAAAEAARRGVQNVREYPPAPHRHNLLVRPSADPLPGPPRIARIVANPDCHNHHHPKNIRQNPRRSLTTTIFLYVLPLPAPSK